MTSYPNISHLYHTQVSFILCILFNPLCLNLFVYVSYLNGLNFVGHFQPPTLNFKGHVQPLKFKTVGPIGPIYI